MNEISLPINHVLRPCYIADDLLVQGWERVRHVLEREACMYASGVLATGRRHILRENNHTEDSATYRYALSVKIEIDGRLYNPLPETYELRSPFIAALHVWWGLMLIQPPPGELWVRVYEPDGVAQINERMPYE